jgi:large subunit ribosomal protein L18
MKLTKREKREKRKKRIREKIFGNRERPRLCVFKSNKHIYAQVIDDEKGQTLASASDIEIQKKGIGKIEEGKTKKISLAFAVGKLIAEKAKKMGIKKVVFDRAGYKYHGRVKSLAEGAREGGLEF